MTTDKRKIFFTDLDGTLLDDKKQIGHRTYEALEAFTKAGNLLVLSSGRDINNLKEFKEKMGLHFPSIYLTGYNGGQIYDCDNGITLYRNGLRIEQAIFIIETALMMDIHCHTYNETHIITPTAGKEFKYYQRSVNTPVIHTRDLAAVISEKPYKCIAIDLKNQTKLNKLRKKVLSAYDDISCMFSCPVYLELFPSSSGKGAALVKLCEILGIPVTNSIAAGDAENDLSMLEAAGYGIAMVNGADSLKVIADYVTRDDNNNDGLFEKICSIVS